MKYPVAIVAVLLVVVVAGIAAPMRVVGQQQAQDYSAGSTLSGAISAQEEATSGELDNAVFAERLKSADTEEERAAIIKERQDELENRSERIRRNAKALGNGTADGAYLLQAAEIAQSQRNLVESVNQTKSAAKELPEQARRNANIDLAALDKLRNNASSLAGPEVAEAARGLAGNSPEEVGPPEENTEPPEENTEPPEENTEPPEENTEPPEENTEPPEENTEPPENRGQEAGDGSDGDDDDDGGQ